MLFLWRVVLAALLLAGIAWLGWKFSGKSGLLIGFVLGTPLAAWLISRYMIELIHEGFSWLWHQPMQEWQGSFYAFDDVQVRIFEVDDRLWFTVSDVMMAVGMKSIPATFRSTHAAELARIPGTAQMAVPSDALGKLLATSRDPRAGRFVLWAERDVVAPWERRKGMRAFGQ